MRALLACDTGGGAVLKLTHPHVMTLFSTTGPKPNPLANIETCLWDISTRSSPSS
jgi:hypothetical protein